MSPAQRPGRSRRYVPGRDHQVKLRCTAAEHALLTDAARSAGLTPSGYAAEAALAAARGMRAPSLVPLREALLELIAARLQVRRYATNVNQAVKALHATGAAPPWLVGASAATDRAVARVDAAAADVARLLRRTHDARDVREAGRPRQLATPDAPGAGPADGPPR